MIPHSRTSLIEADIAAVLSALQKGMITSGSLNQLFATRLANFIGSKGVRLTVSGTAAFYRILLAYDMQPGDEIALPDYICGTLLGPIKALGITPKIYDNAPNSWITSINEIKKVVSANTKAVLVNHTFGMPFKDIKELVNQLGDKVRVIEDCCHCLIPNDFEEFSICKYSHSAFYSFNATKYLATGEGGAIASNDSAFLDLLDETYLGDQLSDLNCALGLSQLDQMPDFLSKRLEIAKNYLEHFSPYMPEENRKLSGAYFRFPILVEDDDLFMVNEKIAYRKGVDKLLSQRLSVPCKSNAFEQMRKTVSIPIYPKLTEEEQSEIINDTLRILRNGN